MSETIQALDKLGSALFTDVRRNGLLDAPLPKDVAGHMVIVLNHRTVTAMPGLQQYDLSSI